MMKNTLWTGDNLYILHGMNSEIADLIYLDPPFNSKRMYSAPIGSKAAGSSFKDMWTWEDVDDSYLDSIIMDYSGLVDFIRSIGVSHSKAMMAYVTYMTQRLIQMYRILKPTGSLYLHCDPTASHYLKIVLDNIFGRKNFRNEIVWEYSTGGVGKKHYARKHDIILFYGKSSEIYFNLPREESRDAKRFNLVDDEGRHYYIKAGYTYYRDSGVAVRDVWDISPVRNVSQEKTGYPTQKPVALLERVIKASSKTGDLVFDPFCGCATTCVAAQQLGRKWIGIDIEKNAVDLLIERLSEDAGLFADFIHRTDIPERTDIKQESPKDKSVKERLFKDQKGHCNACDIELPIYHFEVDHIIPKAKGGGDYYQNYQLLCTNCNRIKGDRPMEYLRTKIETRQKMLKHKLTFGEY